MAIDFGGGGSWGNGNSSLDMAGRAGSGFYWGSNEEGEIQAGAFCYQSASDGFMDNVVGFQLGAGMNITAMQMTSLAGILGTRRVLFWG